MHLSPSLLKALFLLFTVSYQLAYNFADGTFPTWLMLLLISSMAWAPLTGCALLGCCAVIVDKCKVEFYDLEDDPEEKVLTKVHVNDCIGSSLLS